MPKRQAWSVTTPHDPECWCLHCVFRRLERVDAETDVALKHTQADEKDARGWPHRLPRGIARNGQG